jgi:hypothetical protein
MSKSPDDLAETKRLMAALVRMPPKPHEEMKARKRKAKKEKSLKKRKEESR